MSKISTDRQTQLIDEQTDNGSTGDQNNSNVFSAQVN